MKTIEELAIALEGKLWTKGDLKRIYLDRGYNTKKMSTKTYVYQKEDGSFGVKCTIECHSQHWNWIEKEQDLIIKGVDSEIKEALADTYFLIQKTEGSDLYVNDSGKEVTLNNIFSTERFLTEKEALKFIETELTPDCKVVSISKEEFRTKEDALDEIDRAKRTVEIEAKKVESEQKKSVAQENLVRSFEIGGQVEHPKFGIGTVLSEEKETVKIEFQEGIKNLLKQFAPLKVLA